MNTEMNQETTENQEKTFTQDELNKIVQERLAKEKAKYSDYEEIKNKATQFDEIVESNKTELQKAVEKADALELELSTLKKAEEIRNLQTKVATETGVPVSLLTCTTEEELKAQAKAIMDFAKPNAYPNVVDNGEVSKTHGRSAKEQFAEWFNNSLEQ